MGLIAGIDIGNASTEVALAELDGDHLRFVASSTIPTTGIKGTDANLVGIFQALQVALKKAGRVTADLELVRINEAAPVIGDVAMETIPETIITESTMIGHDPRTPGGEGIGIGVTTSVDDLDDSDRDGASMDRPDAGKRRAPKSPASSCWAAVSRGRSIWRVAATN